MKAITVIASPRMEGNCRKIVDSITEGINENNGENKIYYVDRITMNNRTSIKSMRNDKIVISREVQK